MSSDSASVIEFGVYDPSSRNLVSGRPGYVINTNANGRKAYFAPVPTARVLTTILDDGLQVYDVEFQSDVAFTDGNLSCIHKVVEGRNVYSFANSSETHVVAHVRATGKLKPELSDPHTGVINQADCSHIMEAGEDITK